MLVVVVLHAGCRALLLVRPPLALALLGAVGGGGGVDVVSEGATPVVDAGGEQPPELALEERQPKVVAEAQLAPS